VVLGVELALAIEGDMKIDLTPEEFGDARTVRSVAKHLLAKYQDKRGMP
jgi:acyl carrier protein